MSAETRLQRVHIELSRVQAWLFAVPRLRAMVGANALLGETLRAELPKLARGGRDWNLAPCAGIYPAADLKDPQSDHDDPSADAKAGIISRDGGHFEALFTGGAEAFADAAEQLLRARLPGLSFHVSIDGKPRTNSRAHVSNELPVLAPCEWTGRGLASAIVEQGDERPAVSLDAAQRHEAAQRTKDGTAVDVASLLSARTKLTTLERPQELKKLVGDGYFALIHADGNGVGSGLGKGESDDARARFFHRNRVLLQDSVMVHGFNGTSRLWRMPAAAIRRGSVFEISGAGVAKLAERAARREWLGERTHEGFGRFRIDATLPGVTSESAPSVPSRPHPDVREEPIAAATQQWFMAHRRLAKPGSANDRKPSLSQWLDLVGELEADNTNALTSRLDPTTAGGRSWRHEDAKAILDKLNQVQASERKLYARFFVRWLRGERSEGAR